MPPTQNKYSLFISIPHIRLAPDNTEFHSCPCFFSRVLSLFFVGIWGIISSCGISPSPAGCGMPGMLSSLMWQRSCGRFPADRACRRRSRRRRGRSGPSGRQPAGPKKRIKLQDQRKEFQEMVVWGLLAVAHLPCKKQKCVGLQSHKLQVCKY